MSVSKFILNRSVAKTLSSIRALEGQLNSFTHIAEESAIPAPENGRLSGVTVAVKDCINVKGMPTSMGRKGHKYSELKIDDSDAVSRLRASGATIVGKTNLPLDSIDVQVRRLLAAGTTEPPTDAQRTTPARPSPRARAASPH